MVTVRHSHLLDSLRLIRSVLEQSRKELGVPRRLVSLRASSGGLQVVGIEHEASLSTTIPLVGAVRSPVEVIVGTLELLAGLVHCGEQENVTMTLEPGCQDVAFSGPQGRTVKVPVVVAEGVECIVPKTAPARLAIGSSHLMALSRVTAAFADEPFLRSLRPDLDQWLLRCRTDEIRSFCGDGALYLVEERRKMPQYSVSSPCDLLIHRVHTKPLLALIRAVGADNVTIEAWEDVSVLSATAGDYTLALHGRTAIEYPNESKPLAQRPAKRMMAETGEWREATRAVHDAVSQQWRSVHIVSLTSDPVNRSLTLVSNSFPRIRSGLPVLDSEGDAVEFHCATRYLRQSGVFGRGYPYVQIEIGDKSVILRMSPHPTVGGWRWMKSSEGGEVRQAVFVSKCKRR